MEKCLTSYKTGRSIVLLAHARTMRCLSATRHVCLVGVKLIIVALAPSVRHTRVKRPRCLHFNFINDKNAAPLFPQVQAARNYHHCLVLMPRNLHGCLVYNTHAYRDCLINGLMVNFLKVIYACSSVLLMEQAPKFLAAQLYWTIHVH